MRLVVLSLVAIIGPVSRGMAEEQVRTLPEIVIGGEPSRGSSVQVGGTGAAGASRAPSGPERCVEVEIGSSRAMDCLNQKLKRDVDRVNPTMNLPPLDARSPDTKVGVINIPGVAQQYGKNFGVSAVPFRPAPPTFTSPIGARR